jgi:uncharacterized membrane protein YbhN (UPF0104 family)
MLAPDQTLSEFTLPSVDVRSFVHRAALPAAVAAVGVASVVLIGGQVHTITDALRRIVGLDAGWAAAGIVFECLSLAGYVLLLSLVAGGATARVNARVSAQITFAGAAATRLLPTAGVGGAALAMWTLRRAGLRSSAAARTLLAFMVLLYAVFLLAIVVAGAAVTFGLVTVDGPAALSAIPAAAAVVLIAVALVLASRLPAGPTAGPTADPTPGPIAAPSLRARLSAIAHTVGGAVRDASRMARSGDLRLVGAVAYWLFDAAVLWAMLRAFGAAPAVPVVVLAYFVGQAANTLPIPGSVSGGIAAVLIAFGLPAGLALAAVLAYRTVSVWLPTPFAVAALPGLRSTIARWSREDAGQPA